MLSEAKGTEDMKESSVFEWHKHFEGALEEVENTERSCLPKTRKFRREY
jgi:hypothetical protein